jgi:hypothetical protein
MGWVQELLDLFGKLKFYAIVHEYEQGLHFRSGVIIPRRIKLRKKDDEMLKAEEQQLRQQIPNLAEYKVPFRRPEVPPGYVRSFWTGLPISEKRRRESKVLNAGLYLYMPFLDSIVTRSIQETVLNLGNISVSTIDEASKTMVISCNIRYHVNDLYRAYIAVHDYEASLKDHVLSILNKCSRGKKAEDWKNPSTITTLESSVESELKKVVTERWGLKIHKVYVTDLVPCNVSRLLHEGISTSSIAKPSLEYAASGD